MPLSNPQRNFIFDLGGMIAQSTKATFQSSKELYLQDKGADTVVFHQPFPILKGTLSSKEAWTPRERQVPFQSSKELYLPRIAPIHGLLLSSFQSSKELYLLCQLCHPALTVLLSNPQRNFIFPQKHSHSNNFHGSPLAFTFDIGIRQNTTTLGSQQLI